MRWRNRETERKRHRGTHREMESQRQRDRQRTHRRLKALRDDLACVYANTAGELSETEYLLESTVYQNPCK